MPDNRPHPDLRGIETILRRRFERPEFLRQAATHPSQANVKVAAAFERFEFLGDRVLGLIAAELLMDRFPEEREGDLAKRHVHLVRRETLTAIMAKCGLSDTLEGAAGNGGQTSTAADMMEAIIGALYVDGGLDAARRFLSKWLNRQVDAAPAPPQDGKTALQEWSQARRRGLPVYETFEHVGPDHAPEFSVRVSIGEDLSAEGRGGSKRQAEQEAADALLATIRRGGGDVRG